MGREARSSSHKLGFRIDGIHVPAEAKESLALPKTREDLARLSNRQEVCEAISEYVTNAVPDPALRKAACTNIVLRLRELELTCNSSQFFASHELVGTSLLFCCDSTGHSNVWVIDFAKCKPLPEGVAITHTSPWKCGNHEDGWLIGLRSLRGIWEDIAAAVEDTFEECWLSVVWLSLAKKCPIWTSPFVCCS